MTKLETLLSLIEKAKARIEFNIKYNFFNGNEELMAVMIADSKNRTSALEKLEKAISLCSNDIVSEEACNAIDLDEYVLCFSLIDEEVTFIHNESRNAALVLAKADPSNSELMTKMFNKNFESVDAKYVFTDAYNKFRLS